AVAYDLLPAVIFVGAAALIVWRRPSDRVALLSGLTLSLLGTVHSGWFVYTVETAFPLLAMPARLTFVVVNLFGVLLLFVFPDGQFVPRWLRLPFLVWCIWMTWGVMQPSA